MASSELWATDTAVSRPEPMDPDAPVVVNFGGIGFTTGGMAHNLTQADVEDIFTPYYAPEGFEGG